MRNELGPTPEGFEPGSDFTPPVHAFLYTREDTAVKDRVSSSITSEGKLPVGPEIAIPIEEYEGPSPRLGSFHHFKGEIDPLVQDRYRMYTDIPGVQVIQDHVFREWVKNKYSFTPEMERQLESLAEYALAASSTRQVGVRRAYWTKENPSPAGITQNGLETPGEVIQAIKNHFSYCKEKGWHKQPQDKVSIELNLQEYTDPKDVRFDEETKTFTGTTPPIGGEATTLAGGKIITVRFIYGDNRAISGAGFEDNTPDEYTIEMRYEEGSEYPQPRIITRRNGTRNAVLLDRDDKLIPYKLPYRHVDFIPVGDQDIIRAALVAHISAELRSKQLGKQQNRKIEFSLGRNRTFYFNEADDYDPHVEDRELEDLQPKYLTVATIHSLKDVETLKKTKIGSLPPIIVLSPGGISENTTELTTTLNEINRIIEKRKKSNGKENTYWDGLRILLQGLQTEHRARTLIREMSMKSLVRPRIPNIEQNDVLVMEKHPTDKLWIRVERRSGDGERFFVLHHWHPDTIPGAEEIGSKAYRTRSVLDRIGLRTVLSVVATEEVFIRTLKANKLYKRVNNLVNIPHRKLAEEFQAIYKGLTKLNEEDYNEIVRLLRVNIAPEDWKNTRIMARSTNPLEDAIGASRRDFTGEFESPRNLVVNPKDGEPWLHDGILEVMRSLFTPEMAESIARESNGRRKEILSQFTMPLLIQPQVSASYSGTLWHYGPEVGLDEAILLEVQPGGEGVTGGIKNKRTLAIRANPITRKVTRVTLITPTGHTIPRKLKNIEQVLAEFSEGEPTLIHLTHVRELTEAARLIRNFTEKPHDTEYVITPDQNSHQGEVYYVQTRDAE